MDPVSAAANIIAIIHAANRVIVLCQKFLATVKDAPGELRLILIEVSTLWAILNQLELLVSCSGDAPVLDALGRDHGPIQGCRRVLAELENLLPPESILATESKRKALLTAFGWLLKEHKAKTLLDELREHKSTIALALTTDSSLDVKEIRDSIEQLKADSKDTRVNVQEIKADTNDIFAALTDVQEQHVYSWLHATDPSEIHDKSLDTYEPETGEWLFRSPDWGSWLEEKTRCLWVHGIPGAGKTIFASHLIEKVKDHCWDRGPGDVCVYYYCHYSHAQDETAPFLRWVLLELCRRLGQVPQALYDLYRYGGKPTVRSLLRTLEQVTRPFDKVYIFVDAVDESLNRENLLRVLRDLATAPAFENIRLLVTSREYADIEEVMTDVSTPVSMRNPFLDEDIARYIQSKLSRNSRMKRWPGQLREDVRKALSAEANGMFRWVVCQIDAIQRLKPVDSIIKAALANLPKTLDETYERVFSRIPSEHRPFVQHVLHWMGTHRVIHQAIPNLERIATCDFSRVDIPSGVDIPLEVLFQAVERSLEAEGTPEAMSLRDYAFDEELLRELCGCMVTLTSYSVRSFGRVTAEMSVVSFAHYTVLEFLESRRIRDGPAKAFALDRERVIVDHADILLLQAASSADRWGCEMPLRPDADFYMDFDRYCAHSSMLLLHYQGGILGSSAVSSWLPAVLRLMETPAPALGSYFWYTSEVLISLEDPVSPAIQAFRRTHALKFIAPTDEPHVKMLVRLLFLDESAFLAQTYLASLGRGDDDLSSQLDIELHPGAFNDQGGIMRFRGSVLELYAHVPPVGWVQQGHMQGLYKLVARAAGCFDPSRLLMFALGCHRHTDRGPGRECWGCLVLTQLLCLGAKNTAPGFGLGALQFATAFRDLAGVKLLLEAGVDPNEVADPRGEIGTPDRGPLFESLSGLRGMSPLQLAAPSEAMRASTLGLPYFETRDAARGETLEAVLREYGAREDVAVVDLELEVEVAIVSLSTGLEMANLSSSEHGAIAEVGGC